jgi:hypothetical protein
VKLPEHKCGLYLNHNEHRDVRVPLADFIEDDDALRDYAFASEEAKQVSIARDELWTLQWYPETPIGSYKVAAPTLEELLARAEECDKAISLRRTGPPVPGIDGEGD